MKLNEREYKKAFDLHHKEMVSYITYLLGSDFYSEDIVADAFVELWENGVPENYTAKTFLFERSRTKVLSLFQASKRVSTVKVAYNATNNGTKTYLDSANLPPDYKRHIKNVDESEEWADASLIKAEVVGKMAKQMQAMPKGRKKIFDFFFVENMDYPEIAQITGLSINTIRVQKSRIVNDFKNIGINIESKQYWYYEHDYESPILAAFYNQRQKSYRKKKSPTN